MWGLDSLGFRVLLLLEFAFFAYCWVGFRVFERVEFFLVRVYLRVSYVCVGFRFLSV